MYLPEAFQKKMKAILGEEYDDFLAGFEKPRHYGLRVNTAKITVEEFKELVPFHLTQIPWVENGFYIEDAMGSGVKRVFPALLTVILVGLIVSSWIIGGIIPSMVYWGFKVIDFRFFVPIVMAMTGAVAIITGTSFTSIGTIGVSFIIIAKQVGIPLEITAGAIVSGAFLGDKMSPLSDTTNISAALGKTDLFEHIQYMLMDTIPAFIIA